MKSFFKIHIFFVVYLALLGSSIQCMDIENQVICSENWDLTAIFSRLREEFPPEVLNRIAKFILGNSLCYNNYQPLKWIEGPANSSVYSVALSPDWETVLVSPQIQSPDGLYLFNTAYLWDTRSKECINTLKARSFGYTGIIESGCFSPNGKIILTCPQTGNEPYLWGAQREWPPMKLEGHTNVIYSGVFSPDDKTVLTCSKDKTARLWDVLSGALLLTFKGHTGSVYKVAFSPDGKTILTLSADKTVRLWNAKTGKQTTKLKDTTGLIKGGGVFSPNSKTVLTYSWNRTGSLWDARSGELITTLKGHTDWIESGTFSPDGKTVVTCSQDKTICFWNTQSGKILTRIELPKMPYILLGEFSQNGKRLMTCFKNNIICLWERLPDEAFESLANHIGILGALFIAKALEVKESWTISKKSFEHKILMAFPEDAQEIIKKWYSVVIDDKL